MKEFRDRYFLDESEKCVQEDCRLSKWKGSKEYCLFHDTSLDERALKAEMAAYIESASSLLTSFIESASLSIYGIKFNRRISDALKRNINRSIAFIDCNFGEGSFFENNEFDERVVIRNCSFNSFERIKISRARFKNSLYVLGFDKQVVIDECQVEGVCNINSGVVNESDVPLVFTNSSFGSESRTGLITSTRLYFVKCDFVSRILIEAGEKCGVIHIERSTFKRGGMILLRNSVELDLKLCEFEDDIILQDKNYPQDSQPRIFFKDLTFLSGAKVHFNYIDISRFSSSDYVFANISMIGVDFHSINGRRGLLIEKEFLKNRRSYSDAAAREFLSRLRNTYRNLKNYYDKVGSIQIANEFHAGELLIQWIRRRVRRNIFVRFYYLVFSWHTWYWLVSNFGQSTLRPTFWLAFFNALFFASYYSIGIWNPIDDNILDGLPGQLGISRFQRALGYTLRNLLLRFSPISGEYTTATNSSWSMPEVEILAGIQTILNIICFTFLILALRRRFKR